MYPFINLQVAEQRRAEFERAAADYRLARSLRRPRRRASFRSITRLNPWNTKRSDQTPACPVGNPACCPA